MKKLLLILTIFTLISCSENGNFSLVNPIKSLTSIIADAEKSENYPKLDRTNTLAGIDSDKNGIRDDIDSYIKSQNYNHEQEKAVKQSAKVAQSIMTTDLNNKKELDKLIRNDSFASACMLNFNNENPVEGINIHAYIVENLTSNTMQRAKKYLEFNHKLDGTTWSPDEYENPCEK